MKRFLPALAVIVGLLAALVSPDVNLVAQGGSVLTYGQTVQGAVTNNSVRILYTFQGHKGDIIDITLNRTDGNLDPMLVLTDNNNSLIAMDDDSVATSYNATLVSVELPHDGIYFLVATRFGQERGSTTGGYLLQLQRTGINTSSGSTTVLHYGDSVVLTIDDSHYQHEFVFSAVRGDVITVKMQRISGDLDSLLILVDDQGDTLSINDDDPSSPGTLDAAISNWRVERTGDYALIATRFGRDAGTSSGGFSLTLDRSKPETLGKTPDKAILLDYNTTVTGTIESGSINRYYLLEVHKGDTLNIEVTRTSGNLDPTLALLSTDLKRKLAVSDNNVRGKIVRISSFKIYVDGAYLLVVSRFNGETGTTTGDYTLKVSLATRTPTPTPKK